MDNTQELHNQHQADQALAAGRAHGDFRLTDEDQWQLTAKGLVGALVFDLQQLMEPANQARRDLNEQEQRAVLARLQTVKWMLTRIK